MRLLSAMHWHVVGEQGKVHRLGAGVKLGIIFAVLPADVDISNILAICGVLT